MTTTGKITVRRANERGHGAYGWLETFHTFSFDDYDDPKYRRFKTMRVMNEDFVKPGEGFPTHAHRDMEIITYVMKGALEHKDSMGNGSIIQAGDMQYMSAGSGVTHSEYNPSKNESVHLYQIWIFPTDKNLKPRYDQKRFETSEKLNRLRLVVSQDSGDGETSEDGSLAIRQDTKIYASVLQTGKTLEYILKPGRGAWIQVVRGKLKLGDHVLESSDGASVTDVSTLQIESLSESGETEFLLFDLV